MRRLTVVVGALLLAAFGLGQARGGDEKKTEKGTEKKAEKGDGKEAGKGGEPTSYDSPEKVFKAFNEAASKGNGKALCACLTKEASEKMASKLALTAAWYHTMMGGMAKGGVGAPPGIVEGIQGLGKSLSKHGLGQETLKLEPKSLMMAMMDKGAGLEKKLAKQLKNRCSFIAETLSVLRKYAGKGLPPDLTFLSLKDATLEDVKTDGGSATGAVVVSAMAQKRRLPISFTKEQGSWKISEAPVAGLPFMGGPPGGGGHGGFPPGGAVPPPGIKPGFRNLRLPRQLDAHSICSLRLPGAGSFTAC